MRVSGCGVGGWGAGSCEGWWLWVRSCDVTKTAPLNSQL